MKKEDFNKKEMTKLFKEELGFTPPGVSTSETLGEDFQEIISNYHHAVWRDEVIPLKYKYLIALSTAIFADHEVRAKLELKKAIKYGANREEVIEVLRQVVWLKGAPTLVKIAPIIAYMKKLLKDKKDNE